MGGGGGVGGYLLTDSHIYIHITTASIILSVEVITHKIDELSILWACLFTNIFYLCEMMHSLDVSTVFRSKHSAVLHPQTFPVIYFTHSFGARFLH